MSITIQNSGIEMQGGDIQYIWFQVYDHERRQTFFRAVALNELASIPVSIREDYDLLQKQWAAVRGLYNAQADYIYSAAGIFTPQHVGVVQFYGGAGMGSSLDEAAGFALRNLAAVKATLANYEQSRLAAPNPLWVEWYLDFITLRSSGILALLGHPDPRATRRGLGRDGEIANDTGDDLAAEQNELLFRGLAKLREDFIFQVTSERIGRKRLAEGLVRVAQVTSNIASRQRGNLSIGFSLSMPIAMSLSQAISGGRSTADSHGVSSSEGVSHGWGESQSESYSHTESTSVSEGQSIGHASGTSESDSAAQGSSVGHTDSQSDTTSESVSSGHTSSHGVGANWSEGGSSSWSETVAHGSSEGTSSGVSHSDSTSGGSSSSSNWSEGQSSNWSTGGGVSDSSGHAENSSDSVGGGVSGGVPGVASASGNYSHGWGASDSSGHSESSSSSVGGGDSSSTGGGASTSTGWGSADTTSTGASSATSEVVSHSSGGSASSSRGGSESWAEADSTSRSQGTAHSTGSADSSSTSESSGHAEGKSEADSWGRSWSVSRGSADSWGTAKGSSESWGQSRSAGESSSQALGRSVSSGWGSGLSSGLVPGVSIGRSWQSEDDLAIRLTELLRQFEGQLNTASAEGGFMTTAVIFTSSPAGETAARSLVPQAFHGPGVPTPVLTVRPEGQEAQDIRDHALAFLHYAGAEAGDPLGDTLFTKFSTLLTPGQNAAYTAPGLFEEGTAMTVMAPIPKGMAFYPTMPGSVLIGHQYSPETSDLTTTPVLLDEQRMMHTMFAGDTGWGKSVAAIMMAYESTLKWHTRTVVLDFGAGWRQLLNAPGLEGHVDILQLWPDAVRPFRWNPLQIGRQINPETQWRAFADIFGSIARLGVKRQKQELLDALRNIYLRAGALVDDPAVRGSPQWGRVCDEEEADLAHASVGTPLGDLGREGRQALAVLRSGRVGLADLYNEIETKRYDEKRVSARDAMLQGVLDGILFRLNPLVQGASARQFAAGPGAVPLEDLSRPWGISVVEGGAFLDDFGKAFLLGWAGWHLYTDMVARRVNEVTNAEPLLQIYFEEANKVFGGVADGGGEDESGGVSTSQRFADMFRDARKYGCRLHVVTQAPSLIPQDIISSCNNLVVGFLKQPKDKDIVLSALAKSEKGFRDEEWRRFLSNENIGMAIGRFPYTTSRELQQPFLFRPLMLTAPEPSDAEIAARLGRIAL